MNFTQVNNNAGDVNNSYGKSPTVDGQVRIMTVSSQMLCELLRLPPGTKIEGYALDHVFGQRTPDLRLKISHPDFSPILEGYRIPIVSPMFENMPATGMIPRFVGWE